MMGKDSAFFGLSRRELVTGAGVGLAAARFVIRAGFAQTGPIKIGVTDRPISAGLGVAGHSGQRWGLRWRSRSSIDSQGGLLGTADRAPLRRRAQGIPEKARAASRELITRDKVVAIVGEHQSSAVPEPRWKWRIRYHVALRQHQRLVRRHPRRKAYHGVFNPANYNSRASPRDGRCHRETLSAKRVVAFAENTDYGVGLGEGCGGTLKRRRRRRRIQVRDARPRRQGLPAGAAAAKGQSARHDGHHVVAARRLHPVKSAQRTGRRADHEDLDLRRAGIADYPDFWQNVREAGKDMLVFGLYHPPMARPSSARKLASPTRQDQERAEPPSLPGGRSLFLVVAAIKRRRDGEPESIIEALQTMKFQGVRGVI